MDVFISYAQPDAARAREVARFLVERGHNPLTADDVTSAGDDWFASISRAMESAQAVVVLVSRASRQSKWTELEAAIAASRQADGSVKVIPLFLDSVQNAPFFLRQIQGIDVSEAERITERLDLLDESLRAPKAIGRHPQPDEVFAALDQSRRALNEEMHHHAAQLDARYFSARAKIGLSLVILGSTAIIVFGSVLEDGLPGAVLILAGIVLQIVAITQLHLLGISSETASLPDETEPRI